MKDGFVSVACGTPKLRLADCNYNAEQTFTLMRKAEKAGAKVLVLPELGLTGQCLHARELTFVHPRTGEEITVSCELPEEFRNALKILKNNQ